MLSMIPVNSLTRHTEPLQDVLSAAAIEVVRSGHFVLGPSVSDFEREFASYCGVNHCIGVANGTDALELSLRAMTVGVGDHVAVTANAAMYGTSAVLACGAEPVFIDVLAEEATMDPLLLEAALESRTIKAVIVTHLYGRLAKIESIAELCSKHGVALVEDCAQAHGARVGKRLAGSFGDIASFSFYPTKNLGALGDGGGVVTNNVELAERVRKLRQYGWTQKYTNGLRGGRNSRLDEIQAKMLSVMLPYLDRWNTQRRLVANRYSTEILNPRISVPPISDERYVAHLYVIRTEAREQLRQHLLTSGIQTDIHYPVPDSVQPCHSGKFNSVELPVTTKDAHTVLTLPCFPEIEEAEVQRVIEACNRF